MDIHAELLGFIEELRIVDTHEHFPKEAARPMGQDVLTEWLMHYLSCDLVSAGLSIKALEAVRAGQGSLTERWAVVEPYWEAARSTGYGRALDLSAKGIYGIDGVHGDTLGALNEAFVAARARGGHYRHVLRDKSRIAVSILDDNDEQGPLYDCDQEFGVPVMRVDTMVRPGEHRQMVRIGKEVGLGVHCLADYVEAVRRTLDRVFAEQPVVGLKCGLAYLRSLRFEQVETHAAEQGYHRLCAISHYPGDAGVAQIADRDLEDYLMHVVLRWADERGAVLQVHTGLQEGNGNLIVNANPVLLANLFLEYENVKFDIFHMGYPYMLELSTLAKNFPNVYIDMCWGHIISPTAARQALAEWLDTVPANKISAFGGDFCFVDGVYGHQQLARENVARSLAGKVAEGAFDLDRAKQIARWVFVDNPARLFGLTLGED